MKSTEIQGQVVPVTPIQKLLCKLPSLRRKRSRRTSSSRSVSGGDVRTNLTWGDFPPTLRRPLSNRILDAHTSTAHGDTVSASHCSNGLTEPKRAQLAIQQYDQVYDAIVVSTLPYYPFCCHRDLLAMTRPRLLQTAYLFNSCLPFNARFTDLEVSTDAHIRRGIEELVGIVFGPIGDTQQAMSDSLEHCELDKTTVTPPSSPLAMYPSRRNGMLSSPRFLDVLIEEDESDFSSCRRTLKKRKFDSSGNAELKLGITSKATYLGQINEFYHGGMSETITLLCWEIDTPINHIFPVKVGQDEIWGTVKDEIKEKQKPRFDGIAAKTLCLWKVTIDRSQSQFLLGSEDYLKSVTATNPLDPTSPLSTEFKDPLPDGHFNIIIVRRSPSSSEDPSNPNKCPCPDHDTDGAKRSRTDVAQLDLFCSSILRHPGKQATLSRKRRHNELAPVSRLPIEVLGEIFNNLRTQSFLLWIPEVTHVCHAWREVALHTAFLWQDINVTASPSWALEFVLRSKNAPLHITVSNTEEDSVPVEMGPIYDCAEQLVRASVERVQTIVLDDINRTSEHHLRVLSTQDSPNERVTFPILSHLEVSTLDTFILTADTLCAPSLKSLVISRFCLVDWKALSLLQNLSYLEINLYADLPGVDLGDIHKALCQMSNLMELTFDTEACDIEPEEMVLLPAPIQPALLPKLRRICVGIYPPIWLSAFLHCIASGPRRDLSISAQCYSPNELKEMFLNFPSIMQHVEQSSIRSLRIRILTWCIRFSGWRSVERHLVEHGASIDIMMNVSSMLQPPLLPCTLLLNASLRGVHFQRLTSLLLDLSEPVPAEAWVRLFGWLPDLLMVNIRLGLRELCAALVGDLKASPDDSQPANKTLNHRIPFRVLQSITVQEEKGPYSDEDIAYMRRCLQRRLDLAVPLKELHIMFDKHCRI